MINKVIALTLLFFCSTSYADEVFIDYGVGVFNSAKNSVGEVKMADLGYRYFIGNSIYWQNKFGYFGEGSGDPTRGSSLYVSSGPGLEVQLNETVFRSSWGLAAISNPDSYLGGNFPQFNLDVFVGVKDVYGAMLGVDYSHISSAGLIQPNQGRDFMTLQLGVKF